MKISKLFHWLYASLMLLPLAVFVPNAFYYGFNHEAIAQEKTEQVPVYYETNDLDNPSDFSVGNVYTWNDNFTSLGSSTSANYLGIKVLNGTFKDMEGRLYLNQMGNFYIYVNSTTFSYINDSIFDFLVTSLESGLSSMPESVFSHFSACSNSYISGYLPLVTTMSITDSMIYAWHTTWHSEIFSWAFDSFLTEPFHYIGDLFGLPSQHTFYYAFSYWLSISVIWLIFDVVMYVPLLCHRWIDKGGLE